MRRVAWRPSFAYMTGDGPNLYHGNMWSPKPEDKKEEFSDYRAIIDAGWQGWTERRSEMAISFEQWKKEVDRIMVIKWGVSSDDLPDWNYLDAYNTGVNPREAARRAYKNARNV